MRQAIYVLCTFFLCVFSITPAHAAAKNKAPSESGFTLGFAAGYGKTDYSKVTLLNGAYYSRIRENGVAPNIQVLYAFDKYLATELGILYLQKPRFIHPYGLTNLPEQKIKTNLFYLVLKPKAYILDGKRPFYFFFKAGVGYVVMDTLRANGVLAIHGTEVFRPVYGVGLGVTPWQHWSFELGYLGSPEYAKKQTPSINFMSLGVLYTF